MIKQLFLNWEESAPRLLLRCITNDQLLEVKDKWERKKSLIQEIEQLRKQKNQLTKKGEETASLVIPLNQKLAVQEEELTTLEKELKNLTDQLPNLPDSKVPLEEDKIIDETKYEHQIEHRFTHNQITQKIGIVNENFGTKLSGSKFVVYQGLGSQLVHALINFMLAEQQKRGYQMFVVPYLVGSQNLYHTGQLPKFQEDLYKIENSKFYLIPTAEVPLTNLYQDEILTEEKLPLKLCAYSPCFRAEAGAAGKENKGLIRLHQFHKVELVRIVMPERSNQHLKEIVEDARHILHLLKIPHRVKELSVKELGFSASRQYDIEVLLPVSNQWLEISSCSNCRDFQTQRAKIRVKNPSGQNYNPHSLNGSGLAVDRLIIALLEYYYNEKENKLEIPEVLNKYFF
jgi:seryl-tRNA synthetase